MKRALTIVSTSLLSLFLLAACSTMPNSATLMTGIDTQQMQKTAPTTPGALRAETDPVCVSFYKNAEVYLAEAKKPNTSRKFLTDLGVNVATGLAVQGVVPSGLSRTGQIVARQTVYTTAQYGRGMALKQLDAKTVAGKKVIEVAGQIGCPVTMVP